MFVQPRTHWDELTRLQDWSTHGFDSESLRIKRKIFLDLIALGGKEKFWVGEDDLGRLTDVIVQIACNLFPRIPDNVFGFLIWQYSFRDGNCKCRHNVRRLVRERLASVRSIGREWVMYERHGLIAVTCEYYRRHHPDRLRFIEPDSKSR